MPLQQLVVALGERGPSKSEIKQIKSGAIKRKVVTVLVIKFVVSVFRC